MKTTIPSVLTLSAFLCLTFGAPKAQAVVPPPDGGYPGFTTAEGQNALFSLTTGAANTVDGWFSLFSNTDGSFNTAVGAGTLLFNVGNQTTGEATQNTAVGAAALLSNVTGLRNTAVGTGALLNNTTGSHNTAVGAFALRDNTTGSLNTALGPFTGVDVTTANSVIAIGHPGANVSGTTWIGGVYNVVTQSGLTTPVIVSDGGQLGTISSSRRFKKDITPMDKASEKILALKPVTFYYESDSKGIAQFGLIAEEVAEVSPDLVIPGSDGKPYSVRYEAVNAMLLNEFLKEHRKVEGQEATINELKSTAAKQEAAIERQRKDFEAAITELKKEMETLMANSKEQDAKIQRVNDRMEISNSARVAVSNC